MQCTNNCPVNLNLTNGQCVLCTSGTYKSATANDCLVSCPAGRYGNTTLRYCSSCDTMCATCNGGSKINCVSCPTSGTTFNYLLLGMCVASTDCPAGTYADSTTYQCTSCPSSSNCSTCSNATGTIVCGSCRYNSFMTNAGTCSSTCASNQFANLANASCVDCDSSCATCYSQTNNSCVTCASNKFLLQNSTGGYCLTSCPTTLYFTQYITYGQCLPCYATCVTCSGLLRSSKVDLYCRLSDVHCWDVLVRRVMLLRVSARHLPELNHAGLYYLRLDVLGLHEQREWQLHEMRQWLCARWNDMQSSMSGRTEDQ